MADLPALRFSPPIEDHEVCEVLVANRWIRIKVGTFQYVPSNPSYVVFESEDGKRYETTRENVQLKRG